MFMETASEIKRGASLTLPVTRGPKLQSGTPIICGFIPAGVLIPNNFKIPYRDSLKKTGYQRPPQQVRINELANDLRQKRVDLPTAVLLNLRDRGAVDAVHDDITGSVLNLNALVNSNGTAGADFYVVDGQHRILALQKLIAESEGGDSTRWQSFALPFVCMLGADEDEEMDQFYTVNSKAKSVRTDLAYALLKERADRDPAVYSALVERAREWQVDGQVLLEKLAETSPLWKYRIRQPGMEKGETTISSASFVNSLKPLLNDSPLFKRFSLDQRLKVLEAYWQGVRSVAREAFDDPSNYSIQKGVGVIAMHELLPDLIEIIRAKGGSIVEANSYSNILAPALEKLEGDNVSGDIVKGTDFWRAAPDGAAGSYSSSAGRRVLLAKLRQLLPEIQVE
jgi:DGQHR domain-containing protein